MDPINEIELEDCPVCRGAGYIEDEQGWCMYACCLNCGTETAHVSYKTPEERLEAARQAALRVDIESARVGGNRACRG